MRNSTRALLASGAAIGGACAVAGYGTLSKSSQLFGPAIYRGPGQRRSIALTFDDGPSESTSDLLEYFDKELITATFFMCGTSVRRLPAIAGAVAAAGHEIGNHTYSHPYLPFKSAERIEQEFTDAQRIIVGETGVVPMLLRPPYGMRWIGMRPVQEKLSLLAVLWTVIGNDWKWPANPIAKLVLKHCGPGGIVCLHDGRAHCSAPDISEMLKAVRMIVPVLKDRGYAFETVSDLISY